MNYWIIFLTGLTTGGLSCLALQSGLLASAIIEEKEESKVKINKARTISIFLAAKLIAYTILGILLGAIGKFIGLSPKMTGVLDIFIAFFMLGIAGEALKIHPVFRYFLIQPPKFIRKKITRFEGQKSDFTAILLGALTVLIPCGTTQAMMAYAITSASFYQGAAIMFVFILGTIPVFFILGYLATALNDKFNKIFKKVIAILLIILSLFTFSRAFKLIGWHISFGQSNKENTLEAPAAAPVSDGKLQKITIKLNDNYGYNPSVIQLKSGIPVQITLENDGASGCIRAFVIPMLNKRVILPAAGSITFTFTPTKNGAIPFTCSMGMYDGKFIVN